MMNIKIKDIIVKRPSFPKYPQDKKNKICIVKFSNNSTWCPTFDEMDKLNTKLKSCYKWNLDNDLWVSENENEI